MKLPKLNFLFSFAYWRGVEPLLPDLCPVVNVLIDSGAFTNFQAAVKGKEPPVTLPAYIDYCRRYDGRVWQYITLDAPDEPEVSEANMQAMLDAGLRPMPVFVHGESWDRIPELCELADGRLCVAGGVKSKDNYIRHRYQKVWRVSEKRAKIHALGFVRTPDIFQLPLATVDSASYYNGSTFGRVFRYDKTTGTFDVPSYRDLRKPQYQVILRELARCGVTADYMNDPDNTRKLQSWVSLYTVNSYLTFHEHTTRIGPSYFFAIPGASWIVAIVAVLATRRGDLFDYHESRAIYERLMAAYKKNKPGVAAEVARLIRAGTNTEGVPNG